MTETFGILIIGCYLRSKFKYTMSLNNEVDYSIIICTYNPDQVVFQRCLNAVKALDLDDFRTEVILVDNNSKTRISESGYIQSFIENVSNSKIITVTKQGLNHARMAGILESKGKEIIFFDDDNEPEADYLRALNFLHISYPHVGAWGPGNIDIDFLSAVEPHLLNESKQAFQDRHESNITYSNQRSWQSCYPFGTGLSIRKDYCLEYIEGVKAGIFTLSDRKGNELSSGGDTQMVFFLISKGASAGVAPSLSITHIVPAKRTKFEYLKRLTYGTSVCYSTCLSEVFPEELERIESHLVRPEKFNVKILKKMFLLLFNGKVEKTLAVVSYIGAVNGDYLALKRPVPSLASWALKKLKAK
ncbi:glycosyltransferase [Pedobacter sp. JCM 36344]|uniref:glycosyltransferase n=1 Tax=Pedobacter sp. JCM 36344 TaxID=3374280 RepID=UPI00397916DF